MWPYRKHSDRGAILNQDEEIDTDEAHWCFLLLWFNLDNTNLSTSWPTVCRFSFRARGRSPVVRGQSGHLLMPPGCCPAEANLLPPGWVRKEDPRHTGGAVCLSACLGTPQEELAGEDLLWLPMYKVWVGLELQLDNKGIKTSPSSNFCWLKSTQYQNSAYIHR